MNEICAEVNRRLGVDPPSDLLVFEENLNKSAKRLGFSADSDLESLSVQTGQVLVFQFAAGPPVMTFQPLPPLVEIAHQSPNPTKLPVHRMHSGSLVETVDRWYSQFITPKFDVTLFAPALSRRGSLRDRHRCDSAAPSEKGVAVTKSSGT
jgi:hypothetical protein